MHAEHELTNSDEVSASHTEFQDAEKVAKKLVKKYFGKKKKEIRSFSTFRHTYVSVKVLGPFLSKPKSAL